MFLMESLELLEIDKGGKTTNKIAATKMTMLTIMAVRVIEQNQKKWMWSDVLNPNIIIDMNKLIDKRFENDLKFLRKSSFDKVVIGQINITSLQNKFDSLIIVIAWSLTAHERNIKD